MTFLPRISGTVSIRGPTGAFLETFSHRVAAGLLSGRPQSRSNYVVTAAGRDRLHLRAADWWTALNVGLNEVDLEVPQPGLVHYTVQYWRWAAYAIGFSAGLGLIGLVLLLVFDLRSSIMEHPGRMFRGLSTDQNVAIAWAMVLFWGLVWPWILILLHQRPLRRLIERIIAEVDAQSVSS